MVEEFQTLSIGTEVSAKYRGAFCEATVTGITRNINCRIKFKDGKTCSVNSDNLRGKLIEGSTVEAMHPDDNKLRACTLMKCTDSSEYTVEFDDGDVKMCKRNALTLKGKPSFLQESTLDDMPLNNPEGYSRGTNSSLASLLDATAMLAESRRSKKLSKSRDSDSNAQSEDENEQQQQRQQQQQQQQQHPQNLDLKKVKSNKASVRNSAAASVEEPSMPSISHIANNENSHTNITEKSKENSVVNKVANVSASSERYPATEMLEAPSLTAVTVPKNLGASPSKITDIHVVLVDLSATKAKGEEYWAPSVLIPSSYIDQSVFPVNEPEETVIRVVEDFELFCVPKSCIHEFSQSSDLFSRLIKFSGFRDSDGVIAALDYLKTGVLPEMMEGILNMSDLVGEDLKSAIRRVRPRAEKGRRKRSVGVEADDGSSGGEDYNNLDDEIPSDLEIDSDTIYPINARVSVKNGSNVYLARVVSVKAVKRLAQYKVHYDGWNKRYDEWVDEKAIIKGNPIVKWRNKAIPKTAASLSNINNNNSSSSSSSTSTSNSTTNGRNSPANGNNSHSAVVGGDGAAIGSPLSSNLEIPSGNRNASVLGALPATIEAAKTNASSQFVSSQSSSVAASPLLHPTPAAHVPSAASKLSIGYNSASPPPQSLPPPLVTGTKTGRHSNNSASASLEDSLDLPVIRRKRKSKAAAMQSASDSQEKSDMSNLQQKRQMSENADEDDGIENVSALRSDVVPGDSNDMTTAAPLAPVKVETSDPPAETSQGALSESNAIEGGPSNNSLSSDISESSSKIKSKPLKLPRKSRIAAEKSRHEVSLADSQSTQRINTRKGEQEQEQEPEQEEQAQAQAQAQTQAQAQALVQAQAQAQAQEQVQVQEGEKVSEYDGPVQSKEITEVAELASLANADSSTKQKELPAEGSEKESSPSIIDVPTAAQEISTLQQIQMQQQPSSSQQLFDSNPKESSLALTIAPTKRSNPNSDPEDDVNLPVSQQKADSSKFSPDQTGDDGGWTRKRVHVDGNNSNTTDVSASSKSQRGKVVNARKPRVENVPVNEITSSSKRRAKPNRKNGVGAEADHGESDYEDADDEENDLDKGVTENIIGNDENENEKENENGNETGRRGSSVVSKDRNMKRNNNDNVDDAAEDDNDDDDLDNVPLASRIQQSKKKSDRVGNKDATDQQQLPQALQQQQQYFMPNMQYFGNGSGAPTFFPQGSDHHVMDPSSGFGFFAHPFGHHSHQAMHFNMEMANYLAHSHSMQQQANALGYNVGGLGFAGEAVRENPSGTETNRHTTASNNSNNTSFQNNNNIASASTSNGDSTNSNNPDNMNIPEDGSSMPRRMKRKRYNWRVGKRTSLTGRPRRILSSYDFVNNAQLEILARMKSLQEQYRKHKEELKKLQTNIEKKK